MHRHGDIVSKGVIIQYIDREEKAYVRYPSHQWYCTRLEEEGRVRGGELPWPGEDGADEKLAEGDKDPCRFLATVESGRHIKALPLSGSSLAID